MDSQAKQELSEILKQAGIEDDMSDEIIGIFNNYRRRASILEQERRQIEKELRNKKA